MDDVAGHVAILAPAAAQWQPLELDTMSALRRLMGNDSPFGWCDFVIRTEAGGPGAEFCDHFGPVVRLRRLDRRYEVTCLRTGATKRTADLMRAALLIRARWNARLRTTPVWPVDQAG